MLLCVEILYRIKIIATELARKTIHVVSGAILVIWPFYISWNKIILVELLAIIVVAATRWLKIFASQQGVKRITWGEFFFPIGVILVILSGAPRWIYILAVLHLALADSAAALIGTKFGKNNSYLVFGQKKSLIGSAAFLGVSIILVITMFVLSPQNVKSVSIISLILMPVITTIAENLGAFGTDNLLIPIAVVALLSI